MLELSRRQDRERKGGRRKWEGEGEGEGEVEYIYHSQNSPAPRAARNHRSVRHSTRTGGGHGSRDGGGGGGRDGGGGGDFRPDREGRRDCEFVGDVGDVRRAEGVAVSVVGELVKDRTGGR